MKENLTKEDYDKARKHFEEQELLRQLERAERSAADRAANPEKYENLNGKVAILPETNLADPLLPAGAGVDSNHEEKLIMAQYSAVEKPDLSFTKADILDASQADEIAAEQVKIVKMKFSAVGSEPFEWTPEQKDLSDANDPALTDKEKYAIATAVIDIKHDKALNKILSVIQPINFKAIVYANELKERDQLKLKSADSEKDAEKYAAAKEKYKKLSVSYIKIQIVVIDQLQQTAINNRYSLCYNNQTIHIYNGAYWKKFSNERFQKFLGAVAIKMGVDKYTADSYLFRDQLLKQFYASAYLPEPEIDKRKVLINLQNGTFEINNGETKKRDFSPKDFLTYQLPFSYDPTATAPKFQKYLDEVLPDGERQKVIAEYLGYIFIRHGSNVLKEERTLILYGSGANGKSVLFEIVRELLSSENISSYSLESLTDMNGYFRAMIDTKLLNYASEISNRMDQSRFKALVSGEPIEARHPAGRAMQIEQYAKLMFNCNHLPKASSDMSNAFFRRFLIVPFDVTIPEKDQDKNLHTKIIESELAGVFNWILDGLKRLLDQKRFSSCSASDKALNKYKIESDSISLWMAEDGYYKVENKKQFSLLKSIYDSYVCYCSISGYKALNKTDFMNNLERLKIRKEIGSGNKVMFGISALYTEPIAADDGENS
jgi:putative DNA primase/helicase